MKVIGIVLGIVAMLGMAVAFIPLLGWLNWLNIPFAIIGLIFSIIGKTRTGITLCSIAILFGIFRLMLGGGIL
ncbi:MAG TPA: hypothetical protein PK536_05055 [Ignavibacteria bacterium]|nr:hypothetical protein [Ignavibacteria bacterium]HRJ99240.1 hypothetical protein [Ignavibacteria bacterium]